MKVNLDDFAKDEIKIENFRYADGFIIKRDKVSDICFERVCVQDLIDFASKYFGLGLKEGEKNKEIDFVRLAKDLFKVFKQDPRNHWLKLSHLKQQRQDMILLMGGIVCNELLGNGKKKSQKGSQKRTSPLDRYLGTL